MQTDIDRNLHVHTWLSTWARAEQSLDNVIPECARLGYRYIIINDHHHEPDRGYYAMAEYNRRHIARWQPVYPDMRIVLGCEAQMDNPQHCSIDADLAARHQVALELNPFRTAEAASWIRELVRGIRAAGGKVSLGSDAHTLRQLGYPRRDDPTCSYTWADLHRLFGLRPGDLYMPLSAERRTQTVQAAVMSERQEVSR